MKVHTNVFVCFYLGWGCVFCVHFPDAIYTIILIFCSFFGPHTPHKVAYKSAKYGPRRSIPECPWVVPSPKWLTWVFCGVRWWNHAWTWEYIKRNKFGRRRLTFCPFCMTCIRYYYAIRYEFGFVFCLDVKMRCIGTSIVRIWMITRRKTIWLPKIDKDRLIGLVGVVWNAKKNKMWEKFEVNV